jgi:pyruvate,water dikinase
VANNGSKLSTGLPHLDSVLRGITAGDNLVWLISSLEEYLPFVRPYCDYARRSGRRLIYLRFAKHDPLLEESPGVEVHHLDPGQGFEPLVIEIQNIVEEAGLGTYYLFDCLSDLAVDWSSDRMLGNFFMLICPYILDHGGLAYFALLKHAHSFHTTRPVTNTAQIVLDVYSHDGTLYIRTRKADRPYAKTMYMLYAWQGDEFLPVTASGLNTEVMAQSYALGLRSTDRSVGIWGGIFARAEELHAALQRGEQPQEDVEALVAHLLQMLAGSEGRIFRLAQKHLGLSELLDIRRRMIGTGPIGGKSIGMVLAQAILRKSEPAWADFLEPHDSFYIGADVFYTYLVENGLWWIKQKQKDPDAYLDGLQLARHRMRNGVFPDYIMEEFADLIAYFGHSPIAVRSSSLLEDSFDIAFAGKAKSVFCMNQGSPEERLSDFVAAVKSVYASGMSEESLEYRSAHDLLGRDEQMSILVQRVSGMAHDHWFFPHVAGVGLSFNPYVWSPDIDPAAGVLRLVFGLGTRAVDTTDDDFTRVIALNAPERQVADSPHSARQYAQRKMDLLDLDSHEHISREFLDVAADCPDLPLELFATRDRELESLTAGRGSGEIAPWFLTFESLVKRTDFVERMRRMLSILQEAYEHPVDIEFTANFTDEGVYKIGLLQCRPMQVKTDGIAVEPPAALDDRDCILDSPGPVVGFSREVFVDRIIYVVPSAYSELPLSDRYAVAKLIGKVASTESSNGGRRTLLLGPGRWGTSEPFLGIPISFGSIKTVCAICEIVTMREGLTPDVSLGTHFFSELVEKDVLYFVLHPESERHFLNSSLLESAANKLTEIVPDAERWEPVVRVVQPLDSDPRKTLRLNASAPEQRVVCYWR